MKKRYKKIRDIKYKEYIEYETGQNKGVTVHTKVYQNE